ncbi:MAG: tRNA (N(6)-L-threonylcarbamoyladenosine(37)-C(2))-methylthiotransferase MtaB [Helicobacteraceae bacterium]|nr:tRNA (N(6)-L-threonylcarbamoyladenosine(37)-C(2))-methylthiotransferase MtaB [Helicobacteraceae bacterium]
MQTKKVYFKTFGCRTNVFDSQVMISKLQGHEVTENETEADIVIVNSCTVTNSADSGVRSYINQVNKDNSKKIFLTGCGAHSKGESLFKAGKVNGVFGQSEKAKINTLLAKEEKFYEIGDLEFVDENIVDDFVGKSRAFIKVQEGCSFRCNYCIIPSVRGDARSINEKLILEQITRLASNGYGEFVLTGTNVGSYGNGEKRSIASLMKRMSQIRGVRRIRLGSLEPTQINDEFKEILDEPWLERHLHIAIQHSSPEMLKLMNRRNNYKHDLELFNLLSEKGFAIGTDFIVGHPGENEELWCEAIKNIIQMPLTHIHAFTYSARDNTPSATMKQQVNGAVAKERLKELTNIIDQKNLAFREKYSSKELEVLIESKHDELYSGYDQFYNKVLVQSSEDIEGDWINIQDYKVKEDENYAKFKRS